MILLAFEDITERKQEAEARYRRLFEAAKDGILLADAETGEITDMNPFAEQLAGFPRHEIIGRKLWEIEALSEVPDLQAAISRIREEGVVRFQDVPIRTKDGRVIQSEVIGNVYTEKKGRVIQFNIRDISERRKFFRQIQESQKLESLGLLAGGIAHDFNNLLTGIIGNVSLVLSETAEQRSRSCLRDAIRASEQAAHLTRQMLAYAGKGQFVREPLNLSELIGEIHPLIQSSVPKSVNMQFDLLEDPPAVEADRTQMQQLIMNLVINGAEAIPEGQGGTVTVRTDERYWHGHGRGNQGKNFRSVFHHEIYRPGTGTRGYAGDREKPSRRFARLQHPWPRHFLHGIVAGYREGSATAAGGSCASGDRRRRRNHFADR